MFIQILRLVTPFYRLWPDMFQGVMQPFLMMISLPLIELKIAISIDVRLDVSLHNFLPDVTSRRHPHGLGSSFCPLRVWKTTTKVGKWAKVAESDSTFVWSSKSGSILSKKSCGLSRKSLKSFARLAWPVTRP